jgi:hypothetical protein
VDPRAGLDLCGKSLSPPGFDSRTARPYRVSIPAELTRPTVVVVVVVVVLVVVAHVLLAATIKESISTNGSYGVGGGSLLVY